MPLLELKCIKQLTILFLLYTKTQIKP